MFLEVCMYACVFLCLCGCECVCARVHTSSLSWGSSPILSIDFGLKGLATSIASVIAF